MRGWENLGPEDDLLAMERSCFRTFIGPEQAATLLESLRRQEKQDNLNFLEQFAPSLLLEEEEPIGSDDELYSGEGVGEDMDMDLHPEDPS